MIASTCRRVAGVVLALAVSFSAAAAPSGPHLTFTVSPAAAGDQLVRASLPLPAGLLGSNQTLVVRGPDGKAKPAGVRVLSRRPADAGREGGCRALVTFPWHFSNARSTDFTLTAAPAKKQRQPKFPASIRFEGESPVLEWRDGRRIDLNLIAPSRTSPAAPREEVVEDNRYYRWQRFHFADPEWPRVIESRIDAAGGIVIVAHVQHLAPTGNFAPELAWEFTTQAKDVRLQAGDQVVSGKGQLLHHTFTNGLTADCVFDHKLVVYHPAAPLKRRGGIDLRAAGGKQWTYRYQRCTAEDKLPMQPASWQRLEIAFGPPALARLTASLASPHTVSFTPSSREPIRPPLPSEFEPIACYHHDAIVRSSAVGDDFGNVTGYTDGLAHGSVFGMNRLNHGAAIFEEGQRSQDRRLTETGLLWCDNFYDQTVWWGEPERGGARYNNVVAMNRTPPTKDYMWRSDTSVNFCTKGYDCFQLAWEETGDPRMEEALRAQVGYVAKVLHANQGECRNIGDVREFIRLYELTGNPSYLQEALRLFRELRTKLSTGHLFDQGGKPLAADPPFIDDDQRGLQFGYAKPYIIGYALAGLPELTRFAPNEPELKETIRAVADFLASAVDPSGGWRYPHPRSSAVIISQGMEHAWQLAQAVQALGPEPQWLDAIETVLRARILFWQRTGKILSGLGGWEVSTGKVKDRLALQELYRHPADRDAARDYTEGLLSFGSSAPEGLVYFREVLDCYLQHRPAARLLAEPKADEPLGLLLNRSPRK